MFRGFILAAPIIPILFFVLEIVLADVAPFNLILRTREPNDLVLAALVAKNRTRDGLSFPHSKLALALLTLVTFDVLQKSLLSLSILGIGFAYLIYRRPRAEPDRKTRQLLENIRNP